MSVVASQKNVDKITPDDPRIQWRTADLNGRIYEYIFAEPKGSTTQTIFLIHGWPDLAYGWRFQVPHLVSLGYRVVAPNMMGYGGTDAPKFPEFYTVKRACDDLASLSSQLGLTSIIAGGHDWGGVVVYRFALWYSNLVSKAFVICTPFMVPRSIYHDITRIPNFKYQLQLAGSEVEANIEGEEKLRQFFNGIFGGITSTNEPIFSPNHGIFFDRLRFIRPSPLLTESEIDFYVKSYVRNGMRGVLNWYRTSKLNFEDEREIAANVKDEPLFDMPFMFIGCSKDKTLSISLSEGMDVWFRNLTRVEVSSGHWAMVEKAEEINQHIKEFLSMKVKASL